MSVHRTGPLAPTPNDMRCAHRGRDIALKIIDWGVSTAYLAIIERTNDDWVGNWIVRTFDDRNDGVAGARFELEIEEDGGMIQWIKKRLVPEINTTLAQMFPPGAVVVPPRGEFPSTLDGIDAGLSAVLRWSPQPDGTLKVEAG